MGCLRGLAAGVGVWIGHALLVALLLALVGARASDAATAGLIALLASAIVVPSGLCLAMILTLLVGGLWSVGALLRSGRPGTAALAAFVPALAAGLLLMWLGIFGFDTPRRRDIRPLIGPVPDDVQVTSHALLLTGRCGMALIGLALLTPFAFAAWGLLARRESDVPDVTPR